MGGGIVRRKRRTAHPRLDLGAGGRGKDGRRSTMPVSGTAVENRRGSGRWMRNGEQSERGRGKEDGGRPSSGSIDDRAVPTHYCTTGQIRVIT